jgi:hypothetical protein
VLEMRGSAERIRTRAFVLAIGKAILPFGHAVRTGFDPALFSAARVLAAS